ncbi:hypothetical protein ALC60_08239, partial [Trachymyrmex zeteki]
KAALNYIIHDEKRVSCHCLNRVTSKSYFHLARERATWRAARSGLVSVMKLLQAGKQAGREKERERKREKFCVMSVEG